MTIGPASIIGACAIVASCVLGTAYCIGKAADIQIARLMWASQVVECAPEPEQQVYVPEEADDINY